MTPAALEESVSTGQQRLEIPGACVQLPKGETLPPQAALTLRRELESGLAVDPDARRPNFYEASIEGHRYYFWVLPQKGRSRKVFLLACWQQR